MTEHVYRKPGPIKGATPRKFWFKYDQNNSGGVFIGPAYNVYVEAFDDDQANEIAEQNGVYFDGVDEGIDCECCGDRWSRSWYDSMEGNKETISAKESKCWDWDRRWNKGKKDPIPVALFIHLDGTKEKVF